MRSILKYKFILFGILLLPFTSCNNEELTDLNIDPNNPVSVPAINLITQAEFQLSNMLWSRGLNAEWTMLMVQHFAQSEYAEESRYTVDGNDFDTEWTVLYASVLNELSIARQMIVENEGLGADIQANQLAIVDILTGHAYHTLTDLYGDIPFSQALNSTEFPQPQYDDQEAIYRDLLVMMSNAAASIVESAGSFDSGELIYDGDMSKWSKLANSLLLRMAMRVVDVDRDLAAQYIQEAVNRGVMESNADNALFVFDSDVNLANPLYVDAVINNRDDFVVTDVLVDELKERNDPRLEIFAKPTNAGDIVGMPYGLTDAEAFALSPVTSRPNDMWRTATAPAVIMAYPEVMFLLAEAYQRGILNGDAEAAYNEAVTASMEFWGVTDQAAIADYLAANPYDESNWKESIGVQKWIDFYLNGPQAWAEWRRLDYPILEVPAAATNPVIPVRLPYPISEQTRNATALGQVTSSPNDLSTRMWWDVN